MLEPFERGRVLAHPDELDTSEPSGRVGSRAQVPDVFEDGSPRRDADAGADEDGDFVVEDVFGGGAVWAVDANRRHGLPVGERDFVHAHRIEVVVIFRLGGPRAKSVAESAGEVADLADVDGDVGVEGAGGDGEGMPLGGGDAGDVDEEPLSGFVVHARFAELNFQRVVGVTDHFEDGGGAPAADFAVDALAEVDGATPELPAPALVAEAVVPEGFSGEGREGEGG